MEMDPGISLTKAVTQLLNKLNGWLTATIKMLPNLVVAIFVLIIVIKLSNPMARLVGRALLRLTKQRHIARLMAAMTRLGIIALGIILALSVMNLDRAVASLLAGVGILGIAFGFASQDIAANFMSGVLLHFIHPFRIDDLIRSGDFLGYVETMDMRSTQIRNQQGQRITIPNKSLLGNPIINYTITGVRRVDIACGISYVDDLQRAEDLAVEAVSALDLRNQERAVELYYEKFDSNSINFTIRFWTRPEQKTYLQARSDAIKAIRQTFQAHGITIPFQIVTLDFGIAGGESLKEQLEGARLTLSAPADKGGGQGKAGLQE
jgi:small conductance mechanosensitive channel